MQTLVLSPDDVKSTRFVSSSTGKSNKSNNNKLRRQLQLLDGYNRNNNSNSNNSNNNTKSKSVTRNNTNFANTSKMALSEQSEHDKLKKIERSIVHFINSTNTDNSHHHSKNLNSDSTKIGEEENSNVVCARFIAEIGGKWPTPQVSSDMQYNFLLLVIDLTDQTYSFLVYLSERTLVSKFW